MSIENALVAQSYSHMLGAKAKALLDRNPNPTEAEIREAISGNLCRCTGYSQIIEAVQLAAERMGGGR